MKGHVPKFSSNKELADWIDGHDTSEYMDELEVVSEKIEVRRTPQAKQSIGLRLSHKDLEAIKRVANRKGISYQALMQKWLIEKLHQEAPDLLPQR